MPLNPPNTVLHVCVYEHIDHITAPPENEISPAPHDDAVSLVRNAPDHPVLCLPDLLVRHLRFPAMRYESALHIDVILIGHVLSIFQYELLVNPHLPRRRSHNLLVIKRVPELFRQQFPDRMSPAAGLPADRYHHSHPPSRILFFIYIIHLSFPARLKVIDWSDDLVHSDRLADHPQHILHLPVCKRRLIQRILVDADGMDPFHRLLEF